MKTPQRMKYAVGVGICAILLLFITVLIPVVPRAHADGSTDSIIEKSKLNAIYECYKNGSMNTTVSSNNWTGLPDLVWSSGLVTVLDNSLTATKGVNCYQLFSDNYASKIPDSSATAQELTTFFSRMGYTVETNSGAGKCATYNFANAEGKKTSVQMCSPEVNIDGTIGSDKLEVTYRTSDGTTLAEAVDFKPSTHKISLDCQVWYSLTGWIATDNCTDHTFTPGATSFEDFSREIMADINGTIADPANNGVISRGKWYMDGSVVFGGYGDANKTYIVENIDTAANSSINYLSGGTYKSRAALSLKPDERKDMMLNALNNYYGVSYYLGGEDTACNLQGNDLEQAKNTANYYALKVSKTKTCYVAAASNGRNGVPGYNSLGYVDGTSFSFADVVAELNKLVENGSVSGELNLTPVKPGETPGNGEEGDVSSISACFASSGALGWIACPVLEAAGGLAQTLYSYIETNFLQINSNLTTTEGIRSGWTQFRDFANILFAIAFVVVILAQVTGIGISNYNIKKILPRLIMVVVLVNVSFLLCQLAVDLSNLIGYGMHNLFDGFAATAASAVKDANGNPGIPFDFGAVLGGVMGSVFGAGAAITVMSIFAITIPWELWLFPLLLAVIGCLISIFFFLLLLGVRQAGVIILIALAPVTIVCYALPNTKPVFDRWRKMFVGLLLVYPICGLLMGGGEFASTLLLLVGHEGDAGAFFTIVAMLLSVVPFFLIPSILRNSMTAIGNLGAKVTQFGKNLGGGITRGIRGSEWGRNFQRQRQMSYDLKAAQKLQNKKDARLAAGKTFKGGVARRLFLHTSAYNRAAAEDIRAGGGQELLAPGTPAHEAAQANTANAQLSDDTKTRRSVYESSMNTGNAAVVGAEYGRALEQLHANPTDRNALVNVRALQDILSETDDGRGQIQSQMNRVLNNHRDFYSSNDAKTQNSALSQAARHLSSAYGGQYKKTNRGTFAMINDFTNKDFSKAFGQSSDGMQYGISEQDGTARSSYYDQAGMTNYTAQTLPDADEGALQGISNTLDGMAELEKNGVTLSEHSAMQRSQIVATAGDALGNTNIHMKPKVAEQLQSMVIKGNSAQTIGGTNAGALNRMAESIEQNTMSPAEQTQLVSMAHDALSGGHVTNAEKAAALNHILAAAGQPTIDVKQPVSGAGDGDSGDIPIPRDNPAPTRPASDEIFTVNPDGTITGGVKPFTITNGRITDSGIILPPERHSSTRPGSRSSGTGRRGGNNGNGSTSSTPPDQSS